MQDLPSRYYRKCNEPGDDLFEGLFEILAIDEEGKRILVREFYALDDDEEWLEEEDFEPSSVEFISEGIVKEEQARREEAAKKEQAEWSLKRGEKWRAQEKEKEERFALLRPKYLRNTRVILKKGHDRSVLDFARKEDVLYLDDVEKTATGFAYFLRVVGDRKNRGIYVFHTERSVEEEYIEASPVENDPMDFDYVYRDGIFGIMRRDA